MTSEVVLVPLPTPLPRGAKTALRIAKKSQATMRLYSTRGPAKPPEEYWVARASFLAAIKRLSDLGMTHQAIGSELGLSRPAVSNWMKLATTLDGAATG